MSVEKSPDAETEIAVPRVIVCGYGPLGLGLLNGVLKAQSHGLCELVGVFRWCARTPTIAMMETWFVEDTEREFATLCNQVSQAHGVTQIHAEGINSYAFTAMMSRLNTNIILVGSWGEIIRPHVLDRSDILVINCHPSLLPKHRGANPYVSVVRAGEASSGITFHRTVKTIDGGPILLQRELTLSDTDTGGSVRQRCAKLAQEAIPELLMQIAQGNEEELYRLGTDQDDSQKSSYPSPKDRDGRIQWEQPARELSHHVRAFEPWIFVYSYWQSWLKITFIGARVKPCSDVAERPEKRAANSRSTQSGQLLNRRGQHLIVATTDPELVLVVPEFHICVAGLNLPVWLSAFLPSFLLRSGGSFTSHTMFSED